MIHFANPGFLLLLAVMAVIFYYHLWSRRRYQAAVRFPSLARIKTIKSSAKVKNRRLVDILRLLTVTLLILGMARPQSGDRYEEVITEGVDIMLAVDISSSMRAEDFKPQNRLQLAKEVVEEFIKGRRGDRIGMVAFAGHSYTQCPLTLDYGVLLTFLEKLEIGMIEDGTAVGMAIATAVNRLKDSEAKSKIIILLTDGRNNAGEIDPLTAARLAKTFGIKIYTIGAAKPGGAPMPIDDPLFGRRYIIVENDLDEETLQSMAEVSNGMYFRAKDKKGLKRIYQQIDELEKTKVEVKEYTRFDELFPYFVFPGLVLLLLEVYLRNTVFRTIP